MCCMGAAALGVCDCWTVEYNGEQQPARPGLVPAVRAEMCGDCACRPESPERAGTHEMRVTWDEVRDLAATGTPFYCHQGMRRPVREVHPDGAVIEASEHDYEPVIRGDGVPIKLDGTPADLCAGWARMAGR